MRLPSSLSGLRVLYWNEDDEERSRVERGGPEHDPQMYHSKRKLMVVSLYSALIDRTLQEARDGYFSCSYAVD